MSNSAESQRENIKLAFLHACACMKDGKATANSVSSFMDKFKKSLQVEAAGAELKLIVKFPNSPSPEPEVVDLDKLIGELPKKPEDN